MLDLTFHGLERPSCVLLLGAHCDDLEIGCGGTIMQMVERWPNTKFVWVTLSSDAGRAAETRAESGWADWAEHRTCEIRPGARWSGRG